MNEAALAKLLDRVRRRQLPVAEAVAALKDLPFVELGYATVDTHRALRMGVPEIVLGGSKTPKQILGIVGVLDARKQSVMVTRLTPEGADALQQRFPRGVYSPAARIFVLKRGRPRAGQVAVVSAGTSDLPVAEEAAVTAEALGATVRRVYDVGVAGLHRLLGRRAEIAEAHAVVVVAGMEGALASVVGGLVAVPVVAVPTSVGYGAHLGGISALLTMINSCAANVATMNIDNGFGGGFYAALISRTRGATVTSVLYLDPVGGVAGDMFLAAAVDLGVSLDAITDALRGLPLAGWRLERRRAERHAIVGTQVVVHTDEETAHAHRPLSLIRTWISGCTTLSAGARERAQRVFTLLGEAEAKIHGVALDAVEFHEVGAVDSIVDICGAAAALDFLGSPRVFCGAPPLGSGRVQAAHGSIPVPAPATLEILRGAPVRFEGVGELTTPTGAALIRALAEIGPPPELTIDRVGYGVGTRELADRPNVLRAVLGTSAHAFDAGTWVLEVNLDDATPQLLGALLEKLLEEGAMDAYILPATMKKGRPGHLVGVVAPGDRRDHLVDVLLRESTTLGVRFTRAERVALERRFGEVQTRYGMVRVKLGVRGGEVLNAFPEFDDCRARAAEHRVPVKDVWVEALAKAQALR